MLLFDRLFFGIDFSINLIFYNDDAWILFDINGTFVVFFFFKKNIFGKPAPKGPHLKFEVRMGRASNGRSVQ